MKANEILNKIKNIVGVELSEEKIELAELQLENGTIIVSEQFEKGNSVFIKGEDGKIALPVGEYELEDGRVLFVTEEGVIDNIGEIKKTDEIEEELSTENIETELEDESDESDESEKEEMKYVTKEEFALAMDELKSMIEKLGYKDKEEKMSEDIESEKTETIENKQELSAETVEPIKHNPEAETKNVKFTIAGKRTETTRDRVYNKIFNNN